MNNFTPINNSKVINAAAYCRVSTDDKDQLHSLSAQIKYFTDYISQNENWKLKEVYYDSGITGTSVKKRDNFNRMIADAENGEINLILTKEVSRFARNTVDTLSYTRKLSALGVGVIFMNDGIDTRDKDGELRLTIMSSLAQEESRKISERVKWGIRRKMENGYVFGRGKLLGYKVENGVLVVVPDEAEIVKRIFHAYLYERKGSYTIANELNADGILTPNGALWKNESVTKILRNEKYVGDFTGFKKITVDYLTKESRINNGEVPQVRIENHHEGIISREVWDGVQNQINERGALRKTGHKHSAKYWFSSKMVCGKCGKSYTISGNNDSSRRTIRCVNRTRFGNTPRTEVSGQKVGCDNKCINQVVLDVCMSNIIGHIQTAKDEIIADLLYEIGIMQKIKQPINVCPLENKIADYTRKKREAIDLMLDKIISKDDLRQQTEYYDSEITRLTEEINHQRNTSSAHRQQIAEIEEFIAEIGKIDCATADNTVLYGELLKQIIVYPDNTVDFYLNCVPFPFRITYHNKTNKRNREFECIIDSLSAVC